MPYDRTPWWEEFEKSMAYRWLQKPVLASRPLTLTRSLEDWSVEGIARIAIVKDNLFDGQPCFRFRTALKEEAYLRRERNSLGSFSGESGGGTSAILRFSPPQDWSAYNRIAAWVYVHPVKMKRVALNLQLEPNFRASLPPYDFISFPRPTFHAQHLTPGQWNLVLWEITDYPREAITGFVLSQELFGYEPGTEGVVTYDVGRVELQRIEAEKYEGWEVAPGRIAYSHVGYVPWQRKIALSNGITDPFFLIREALSGEIVDTRPVQALTTPQGRFQVLDFSDLPAGYYRLQAGQSLTGSFSVGQDLWRTTILKLLNFYFCERCNYPVPGLHDACHKDLFGVHGDLKKPINGGWHDAADFSQGCHQTGLSIYAMLKLYQQYHLRGQETFIQAHLLEEARWGLDWLLKTRFGGGYRIAFQVARIYTDNLPGSLDDILIPARNLPFLNLLASGVEALASLCYRESDLAFAEECLRCAVEDWQFGSEGETGDLLTASWGAVASVYLHLLTGESLYAEKALAYGKTVLACQERAFVDGLPLTGYFYRDPSRAELVHYNHLGFAEAPVLALAGLCQAFPDHPDWIAWYASATLHAEYTQKRGAEYTTPFYMLPNGVYRLSEFGGPEAAGEENLAQEEKPSQAANTVFGADSVQPEQEDPGREARQYKLRQVREGVPLGGDYYLKRFPVWDNALFHGATGVQLSQALALNLASGLRSDLKGQTLALRQLQWVIGFNPFSQSLMYGEGYDYLSLHAHRQMDMVGALPVGMDCRSGDQPYWSPSNFATQKEIWVVPASRFLWNLAFLNLPAHVTGRVAHPGNSKSVGFHHLATGKTTYARLDAEGTFSANLPAGEYQLRYGNLRRSLTLTSGSQVELPVDPESFLDLEITVLPAGRLRISVLGRGRHHLDFLTYNARPQQPRLELTLEEGYPEFIAAEFTIENPQAPWLALIVPDGQRAWAKEVIAP